MKNPFNHPAMVDISLFLARLTLGLYMLATGWRKISGPGISGFVNNGFMPLRPEWLPEAIARPYGYAIPVLEFTAGLLVLLGLFTRWSAGVMALMLLSIFVAVVSDRGLSGGDKNMPFHYSILLASGAFVLAIIGAGRLSLDALYFSGGGAGGGGGGKPKG